MPASQSVNPQGGTPFLNQRRGHTAQNRAYSVNTSVLLHGLLSKRGRRLQGAHTVSATPSAEIVRLRFVERAGLRALLGLGTWLWLCLLWSGQRLRLRVLLEPRLPHHFAHQHLWLPHGWGDAKSPERFDKYFPARYCTVVILSCRTLFNITTPCALASSTALALAAPSPVRKALAAL